MSARKLILTPEHKIEVKKIYLQMLANQGITYRQAVQTGWNFKSFCYVLEENFDSLKTENKVDNRGNKL